MLTSHQLVKLKLMTEGLAVTEAASFELSQHQPSRPLTLADYVTTSGISLGISGDIWVNAPIRLHNPNFVSENTPHILDLDEEGFFVRSGDQIFRAKPLPVPDYHDERNSSGELYTDYAVTHLDRVRISPIDGCGMVCTFCDVPFRSDYRRRRIDGLVSAVRRALDDKALPAKHILISGGTPKAEDYDFLRTVYRVAAEEFKSNKIDIMMVPVPGLLNFKELHQMGINGLSLNLEIYNEDIARRAMRAKFELGRQYYLDVIEEAVSEFGLGRVRSLLIVGIEPPEDTLTAVHELAKRGCDPVLSPFRPDPSTPLKEHRVPTIDLLERVYFESLEIVSAYPVKLGPRCIPCQHNALVFPEGSESYYYS